MNSPQIHSVYYIRFHILYSIMTKILKLALCTVLAIVVSPNVYSQIKKPLFLHDEQTGKYGYKSDYRGEWLTPPVYEFSGWSEFGEKDYAIVNKEGKYNVLNLSLTPILPEWGSDLPKIHEGFIVIQAGDNYKIYDMSGQMRLIAKRIDPLLVTKNSYNSLESPKKFKRETHLLGFSVGFDKNGPFFLYDLNLKMMPKLKSASPITSDGGLLLFTEGIFNPSWADWNITGGSVTDALGNEIEHINGFTKIMSIVAGEEKIVEGAQLERLYGGYMPNYILEASGDYKAKGRGVFAGQEIVKKFGFETQWGIDEKKKGQAKKSFRKPEIVALYKKLVLTPLEERLRINQGLLAGIRQKPEIIECKVIKYGSGYALSADGSKPILSNNKVYDSLEPIGNRGLLLGKTAANAELVALTGNIIAKQDRWVDFCELDKGKNYIAALRTDGKLELLDAGGNAVGLNIYDDIIPTATAIGEIFYVVNGTQWGVWAPGYKDSSPKIKYHYIGLPDLQGVVNVRYNGFPGTYNLKTSEEVSPTKNLFDKAYDSNTALSDATRIGMYLQVIELDKETREGYTGAAFNNIGAIYEDAGDEDTAYDYYERAMNVGNKMGEKNYKRIRNNRRLDRVAAIAGAIADASQSAINVMSGGISNMPITQYNAGYGDLSSFQSDMQSSGGYSVSFYQEQYNNWERRAQGAYESLTLLGSRSKRNGSEVSGSTGQSMSSSNYTRQKKCLRDAQTQMRSIRQKARRDGVNIAQSHWETVTVSY